MGYEFEVEVWIYVGNHVEGETSIDDYQWNTEYSGDDQKKAFQALAGLKDNGAKCARITCEFGLKTAALVFPLDCFVIFLINGDSMEFYKIGEKYFASYSEDEITLLTDDDFAKSLFIAKREMSRFCEYFGHNTKSLKGDDEKLRIYFCNEIEKLKNGRDVDANGQMKLF